MAKAPAACQWITLRDALAVFAANVSGHQGAEHIKPLHWYVACRLVLEGGFRPSDITPRPPFVVREQRHRSVLEYNEEAAGAGERTLLGGLKTKDIDVVAIKEGIGPVLAVSTKGSLNAFRNLTNRMEEAVGDCTNLHISYPTLVYGFLHVIRANREGPNVPANDVAICQDGTASVGISRYHDVLCRLSGRGDIRNATTRYEAIALALVNPDAPNSGELITTFPPASSPLLLSVFFEKLYQHYDQRFVYAAPGLRGVTQRLDWAADSPALLMGRTLEYAPRVDHRDVST
jgi:hypothetical protein